MIGIVCANADSLACSVLDVAMCPHTVIVFEGTDHELCFYIGISVKILCVCNC